MRWSLVATALILAATVAVPRPAAAQGIEPAPQGEAPQRRGSRAKREPTVGQVAARERQKKCGLEWREAKAKGTTGGLKWPQYWSACNKRMKGSSV